MIAWENVRLFQELKESLEQQTATSEILGVIASSPTDIQPVLDAVAENAARLCDANDGLILRIDGESPERWRIMDDCRGTWRGSRDATIRGKYPVEPLSIDKQFTFMTWRAEPET